MGRAGSGAMLDRVLRLCSSGADARTLRLVTAGLRRAQAATFTAPSGRGPSGPVLLLLSPELSPLAQTPQADGYLRALVPPEGAARPVPAG